MLRYIAILFFSTFFVLSSSLYAADAQRLNSVVAIVNDSIITQTEFDQVLKGAREQIAAGKNSGAIDESMLQDTVLQQLIDEKLELELAKRTNITVTDAQLKEAVQHVADSNHISVEQLKNELAKRGVPFSEYQNIIRKQIIVHQVQQAMVGNKVHVSDQDIALARKQFQAMQAGMQRQYHVIDIVSDTKKDAEKILAELKSGKKIDAVAPNAKDLGWRTADALPTLFLEQLKNMQSGDVAGPIQAPNGFHVIQLAGIQGNTGTEPTKEVLQNIAYQIAFQKEVKKWLVELRKTAYIKIID